MKDRIDAIIVMSCLGFKTTPQLFFSPTKERPTVKARKVAATLMREVLKMKVNDIAAVFNVKHSSVCVQLKTARLNAQVVKHTRTVRKKYTSIYGC